MGAFPICIDFGSSHIRISIPDEGLLLEEPSTALVTEEGEMVAYGGQANAVLGKAPSGVREENPIKRGSVAHFDLLLAILKDIFKRRVRLPLFSKKHWILSCPLEMNTIQKRVMVELADQMKMDGVYWIPSIVAALNGFNQDLSLDQGWLVVQSGLSITDLGITTFGGIVKGITLEEGGGSINHQIMRYTRRTHHIQLGNETAEQVKKSLFEEDPSTLEVNGRDAVTGIPKSCMLDKKELIEVIQPILSQWLHHLRKLLEHTPAQLSSDIMQNGILLSGGNSVLGFSAIKETFFIDIHLPEQPQQLVIKGLHRWANEFPEELARRFEFYSL